MKNSVKVEVPDWHSLQAAEVIAKLQSNVETGLNDDKVSSRRKEYESDRLTHPQERGSLIRFLLIIGLEKLLGKKQFFSAFMERI